jgi:hypothetical protein
MKVSVFPGMGHISMIWPNKLVVRVCNHFIELLFCLHMYICFQGFGHFCILLVFAIWQTSGVILIRQRVALE